MYLCYIFKNNILRIIGNEESKNSTEINSISNCIYVIFSDDNFLFMQNREIYVINLCVDMVRDI